MINVINTKYASNAREFKINLLGLTVYKYTYVERTNLSVN